MKTQSVVYLYNGILLSNKRNVIILATTWKNLKGIKLSEGRQFQEVHTE